MSLHFIKRSMKRLTRSSDKTQATPASSLAEAKRQQTRALHPSSGSRKGGSPISDSLIQGEVMIRRLSLVAGPAGSEWRNPRQQHPTITTQTLRSSK